MVQPTSAQAYHDILTSGLLGEWHRKVVQALIQNGPMTGRELDVHLGHDTAHKRPSELEVMGVVRKHSTRTCRITGREAIAWELTGNRPQKVDLQVVPLPHATDIAAFLAEIRPLLATKMLLQPGTERVLKYLDFKVAQEKPTPTEQEEGGILDLFG